MPVARMSFEQKSVQQNLNVVGHAKNARTSFLHI